METEFYHTPHDAWQVMYDDCAGAESSIYVEHYIMRDDEIGRRFIRLFIDKVKQGVEVALVLDYVGSRGLDKSPLIDEFRKAGGALYFFNPLKWSDIVKPWKWFPRNHNKILLVDHYIGHIGSVCFCDIMRNWRDIHMRFTGRLVQMIEQDFKKLICVFEGNKKERHFFARQKPVPYGRFYYATSEPHLGTNVIYKELLNRIRHAKKEIYLVTPYFLPTKRLLRAIRKAAKRNVAVHIMVSEKTDVPIADRVSRSYMPKLFRRSIHMKLYEPEVLHAKYAVIDREWAMLGSTNLDYLSLLRNREANILVQDKGVVDYLVAQFAKDSMSCIDADWDYWDRTPLSYKLAGYLGRIFKRIL